MLWNFGKLHFTRRRIRMCRGWRGTSRVHVLCRVCFDGHCIDVLHDNFVNLLDDRLWRW